MSPKALKDAIRQKAGKLGFELVGMVPVQPSNTHQIYKAWLEKGYAGEMAYLERHMPLKQDPRNLLPAALSLVALAFNYYTGAYPESDGSKGKIRSYTRSEGSHKQQSPKVCDSVLPTDWIRFRFCPSGRVKKLPHLYSATVSPPG